MRAVRTIAALFCLVFLHNLVSAQTPASGPASTLIVKKTTDFSVTGTGTSANWAVTDWINLQQRDEKTLRENHWDIPREASAIADIQLETKFKILYSEKGIYCLYQCEDSLITATLTEDFSNIFNEDVVEAFFWPDTSQTLYFEYELSPLNVELPILIVKNKENTMGWKPWFYSGARKTIHAVSKTEKGKQNRMSWTAEFFIPFALLHSLGNTPPVKGSSWRANFYRIDYDRKPAYTSWQLTRNSYHDIERFGKIIFE